LTGLIQYEVSRDLALSDSLKGILQKIKATARKDMQEILSSNEYSNPEKMAALAFRELEISQTLEVATVAVQAVILNEIDGKKLWAVHPQGSFNSLEHAASHHGMSPSEVSDARNMHNVIFPYLEAIGYDVAETWSTVGKSNFRTAVPVLAGLIKGETLRDSVQAQVEEVLGSVDATSASMGEKLDDTERRRKAIEWVLDSAQLPSKQFRKKLKPDSTPDIEISFLRRNGSTFALTELSEDQETMLIRLLSDHAEYNNIPEQTPVRSIPILRRIIE
jgi:hypothetical protein